MRLIRSAAALLIAAIGTLAFATPAHAGGWATTLLDPLPERLEPGQTYTIGYWVLQHGSHPYEGDLGRTGLRLTDDTGTSTMYEGTALPEPAHYAAAVVFGRAGTWQLTAVQGIFADYEIGAAIVPGGIRLREIPPPMIWSGEDYWGDIRPPLDTSALPVERDDAPLGVAASDPQPPTGSSMPGLVIAGLAIAAVAVALLAMWPLRSRLPVIRTPWRRTPRGTADSGMEASRRDDRVDEPVR